MMQLEDLQTSGIIRNNYKVRIRSHPIQWRQTWKHPCALVQLMCGGPAHFNVGQFNDSFSVENTQNDCAFRCGVALFVHWGTRPRYTHTSSATKLLVKTAAFYQDKLSLLLSLASRFVMCHQLAVVLRAHPRCTQVEKGEVEGRNPSISQELSDPSPSDSQSRAGDHGAL